MATRHKTFGETFLQKLSVLQRNSQSPLPAPFPPAEYLVVTCSMDSGMQVEGRRAGVAL